MCLKNQYQGIQTWVIPSILGYNRSAGFSIYEKYPPYTPIQKPHQAIPEPLLFIFAGQTLFLQV